MLTLYKYSVNNSMQAWTIYQSKADEIMVEWGQAGGSIQRQVEIVAVNESGRTLQEQVQSRINSRINKQLDKGYCYSADEARQSKGLNASKLLKPMLAQVYDNSKKYDLKNMFWQYKYNGHRCLITKLDGAVFAYSRNGKPIETINHIIKNLDIPEGCTLDGELYIHGAPLQTISSLVRRKQPDNVKLKYIVYDTILNQRFSKRLDFLHKLSLPVIHCCVATTTNSPEFEMLCNSGIKKYAHANGYEGFILRADDRSYEPGARSSQLLKVKTRHDAEAVVISIAPSADGWAVLHCVWNGRHFKMTAPGTIKQRHEIYENSAVYIGRKVTFEYAELTHDGVPFHPVAISFREEE